MNLEDAILWLKRYQGYEPFENGVVLKHSFDLTDETVDTILLALSSMSIGKPLALEELQSMEGQKVLLYRMKSTEPLELGTVKQNGDVLGDVGMLAYHELYLETWVAFSYQVQEPGFYKPLTLEQLRGMEHPTPVWAKVNNKTVEGWDGYWCLCCRGLVLTPGLISIHAEKMDGVEFYSYPPVHIDREAWISVNDRLPKAEYGESDSVLTICELGVMKVLYFDGACWCNPTGEVIESKFKITHWMPLPEPPAKLEKRLRG